MMHGSNELRSAIFNYERGNDRTEGVINLLLEAIKVMQGNVMEFREVYSNK